MSAERARELIAAAIADEGARVAVLTGAGISAESGVPTFRGAGGLWREHRATDLATPEAFAADPVLVWDFYDYRREVVAPLAPNPAHHALVRLETAPGERFRLFTQNIDGLHHAAGSERVDEIHGSLWTLRCTRCGAEAPTREVPLPRRAAPDDERPLPRCGDCAGLLRPAVVWFGEGLDPRILDRAERWARTCQLFLVIGTSSVVYPAAALAPLAQGSGAVAIEVNLEATPVSDALAIALHGKAGEVLPELIP